MRVLVLSFYFRPDLSAGSFRTSALVDRLQRIAPADAHIDVITTLPNRYHSYSAEAPAIEQHAGITIRRIALRAHRSGMVDQARAYVRFAREAAAMSSREHYDVVYATSSRLMTAVLGAFIAGRVHAPFYLDIRDIFVDTIGEVFRLPMRWFVVPVFSVLERYAIRRARRVNVVSGGFRSYFTKRYPGITLSFFTNGVDEEFVDAAPAAEAAAEPGPGEITLLYAGNVGEGQGLHAILPRLAKALEGSARFRVIGDGGRMDALRARLAEARVTNVELAPPMTRGNLIRAYQEADVLFLHLNDFRAFRKVLPSKLFEYAAMGKPILAGIAGYSADFVRENITNAAVFAPCDVDGAIQALRQLSLQATPRTAFVRKFSREAVTEGLARDVLSLTELRATTAAT